MTTYPREAEERGQQGRVVLSVLVDAQGTITSIQVKSSSGYTILDKAAMDWVRRQYRFPAGRIRRYEIPFVFSLK